MTRFLLLLLLNWEAGFSSSSCPRESFHCREGGLVPLCLGYERQPSCPNDTNGCQKPRSICRNHTCRCGNSSGPCLPFERFCDQRQDCPDGSDEAGFLCASKENDCEMDEFRCYPGAECFPLSFKCDDHLDCEDGADEEGCGTDLPETPRSPQITRKGSRAPPETPALDPLTITAIVGGRGDRHEYESVAERPSFDPVTLRRLQCKALLVTIVAAAGISLWISRRGRPLLAWLPPKAALKQLIRVEHP